MKPQVTIPTGHTSERRAAAARGNGAKSRGPVTAIGKANSSRNGITQNGEPVGHCPRNAETSGSTSGRHGLRSRTLFADPESAGQLTAMLASFERTLIGTISRLESRCERQYDRAVDPLTALRAHGIFKKINIHERPQQVIENTAPHSGPTHSATKDTTEFQSAGNPDPKKIIVHARTQQAVENTTPLLGQPDKPAVQARQ